MENLSSLLAETTRGGIEKAGIELVKNSLRKLYCVWEQLDLDAAQKIQRSKITWTHMHNLLLEIIEEEKAFCKEIRDRVRKYSSQVGILSKALLVPAKEVNGSLIQREESLRQELDGLNALKEKRQKAYQDLKNTVLRYCKVLNVAEAEERGDPSVVPSEGDLERLERRVSSLKVEKEKRGEKFLKLKKELTTILETTELPPEDLTTEENDPCLSGTDLSDETFEKLEGVVGRAKKRKSELESRKGELLKRLSFLWGVLGVEEGEKVGFLSRHIDLRPSTFHSMEGEVERCVRLQRENAKAFSEALREELEELWNVCYVSVHQRALLRSGIGEDLEKLEEEVRKWRSYRDEASHLFGKIERRRALFEQMCAFENKSSDPGRFRNRKGNLLLEERERRRLQKELPALEEDLFRDIKRYEEERGSPFLYHGGDFRVFVSNQWSERRNEKESKRLERHKEHLLRMQSELNQGGRGACIPSKRPNPRTPQSAPCKLSKPARSTPDTSGDFLRTAPNTVDRLTSCKRRPQHSRRRPLREEGNVPKTPDPEATTYSQFADALQVSSRSRLQSSVLSTKKRGGTRTSSKKKRAAVPKQTRVLSRKSMARGKFGVPFLL